MILKCIKVVAAAAFALVSLNVSGQDLLARQAPIDRKLKAVDSVALIRQIKAEKAAYPAYTLYPNWSNERVHAYGNTVTIPDTFRIDMTGFHMPTEHQRLLQNSDLAVAVCTMDWILKSTLVIRFVLLSVEKCVW